MANELTGDYDVVAEFTVAAINRILSGMHRGNRFPHSMSVRVDDTPDSKRSARSIVDIYGSALTDRVAVDQTARPVSPTDVSPHRDLSFSNLDPLVNELRRDNALPVFSHLQGIAQLQLGAPTIGLPDDGSANATVHTPAMIRYFPDPFSLELPEFMRGEIVTTLGVRPNTSGAGAFIDVGLVGPGGNIHFNQVWPPQPLSAEDLRAVNKALRNSLTTSFQPSNAALPDNVANMDFKAFPDALAVAAMMSLQISESMTPSPDSMETVFLHDGDHFATALDGNAITKPFADAINGTIAPIGRQNLDTRVQIDYFIGTYTFHIFTNITVLAARVELQDVSSVPVADGTGQILLTIPVQVRFGWEDKPTWAPDPVNFDFTVTQAFALTLSGADVGLQALGNVAINIPSNVPAAEANEARKRATDLYNNAWNSQQAQIQQQISAALSVRGLQEFLRKLMNPVLQQKPDTPAQKQQVEIDPSLTYTSFEIKRAGIVLHGSLALPDHPGPHVEYDLDPWKANSSTPELNALNSWIPGGTIDNYLWRYRGNVQNPDSNTFISTNAPAINWSPISICLTVSGSRLSASGPVGLERVSSSKCKGTDVPKAALNGFDTNKLPHLPDIVLDQPHLVHIRNPEEVMSHVSPWVDGTVQNTANFLIHFPDMESAAHLDFLTRALEQSRRSETATAILVVLSPDQLARAKANHNIMLADDAQGWERLFDISSRPSSVLLSPSGQVAWRHQGALTRADLATALEKHLSPGGFFTPRFLESPLRTGQLAPNFLFESAPGQQITLRKLTGRFVVMVFVKSSSKPSLETLRDLHKTVSQLKADQPVVLAITDRDDAGPDFKLAAAVMMSVVIVPDPNRQISAAYGVRVWPTSVFLDTEGRIKQIMYGRISEEQLQPEIETRLPGVDKSAKEY